MAALDVDALEAQKRERERIQYNLQDAGKGPSLLEAEREKHRSRCVGRGRRHTSACLRLHGGWANMHKRMRMRMHTHMYTCAYAHTHARTHTRTHTCTHTHSCTHACMHTHTLHACTHALSQSHSPRPPVPHTQGGQVWQRVRGAQPRAQGHGARGAQGAEQAGGLCHGHRRVVWGERGPALLVWVSGVRSGLVLGAHKEGEQARRGGCAAGVSYDSGQDPPHPVACHTCGTFVVPDATVGSRFPPIQSMGS